MKPIIILLLLVISFPGISQSEKLFDSLFNGKDLSGWIMPGDVPGFAVEKGIMVALPTKGSDIFTDKYFGNFIFRFEYLLSEVGNSGVLIRSELSDPWRTGVEIQLLAPWTPYRDDLHCTGSIYGHVAVSNRPDETTGIWHEMEIKCDRKLITISVDGKVTTIADIDTVTSMQNKNLQGAIGFQSNHSNIGEFAHFRNIFLYDLDSEPEYVAAGFYEEDARLRKQAREAAEELGAPMIKYLTTMFADKNTMVHAGAKQVLFDIAAKSASPGALNRDKKLVVKALETELKNCNSLSASSYLGWLMDLAKAK